MRITLAAIIVCLLFQYSCNTMVYRNSVRHVKDFEIEKNILKHINRARVQGHMCGKQYYEPTNPVAWNKKLAEASLQHSLDMAENGFLSHIGSSGEDLGVRLFKVKYDWSSCAENIGHGYRNAEEAVMSWLESKMHCKNIMNPEFQEIGAASAKSRTQRTYWTVVFGRSNH